MDRDDQTIIDAWLNEYNNPLRREMNAAQLRMDAATNAALMAIGVPAPALFAAGMIGLDRVCIDAKDYWQPDEAGTQMIIVPASTSDQIIDLIAFDIAEPDAWYVRTGQAWALGMDDIDVACGAWPGVTEDLWLHPTPIDWLRAETTGACVVQWCDEARHQLRNLAGASNIRVSSPLTAQRLRLELTRPPHIPNIIVGRHHRRAA